MNEREIFDAALAIEDAAQRAAYLEEACAGDLGLRAHIAGLLEMHGQLGSFLEGPARLATLAEPIREGPGTVVGQYKLLEQIGEGGFGVVFMAEQTQPVRRKVALKILKPGMDTSQVVARFEAERQALAIMDHPNIAKVLEGGQTTSGRPYFVMDLVKGVPITEFCDQSQLTPRERLELFVHVCQAVQHAHQKGIIHRDIKPANVLVTMHDGTPRAKVIDFGIAKALGQQLTDKTLFTGFAQMIGTPMYMSPEQAALSNVDVDTRSDIYSLGVLLYELLTGTTPFDKERFKQAAYDEIRRIIREEDPPKPSTRISTLGQAATTLSTQRQSDPKRLSQLFRGELDWIVMKCLEKDRNRRYESASALAADVERYLHDEPVQACPPSAMYRFRKFARRNKGALLAAAAVLLALLAGTALSTWQAVRARQAEVLAEQRLEAEKQARRQALANLQKARDAVDQMLSEVGAVDLAHVPQMEPVRRALLEKALRFYQGFLQTHGTDPSLRLGTSEAYAQMGMIYRLLGQHAQEEQAQKERIALLESLVEESPAEPDYRAALASAYVRLGDASSARARWLEAEKAHLRALRLWEQLVAEFPGQATHGQSELRCRLRLAAVHGGLGRVAEALAAYQQVLPLLEALARSDRTGGWREELAQAYHELGGLLVNAERKQEAEPFLRQSVEVREKLAAEFPKRPNLLVRSRMALAYLLEKTGQHEEAETLYRDTIPGLRKLVDDFPHTPQYRAGLASAYLSLLELLSARRGFAEAEQIYSQAREQAQRLVTETPDREWYWNLWMDIVRLYGFMLAESGRHVEAEKTLREALDIGKKSLARFPNGNRIRARVATVFYLLAKECKNTGRPQEAEAAYREAIDWWKREAAEFPTDPEHPLSAVAVRQELGGLLAATGRLPEAKKQWAAAVAEATKGIDLNPGDAKAWKARGGLYAHLELWENAAADFAKAVELRPHEMLFHQELALARIAAGDRAGYRTACASLLDRFGQTDKPEVATGVAASLALTADAVQDLDRPVKLAELALRGDPKNATYAGSLGTALYRAGRFAEAIQRLQEASAAWEQAATIPTTSSPAYTGFFLAMAHHRLGRAEEARRWLDKATKGMEQETRVQNLPWNRRLTLQLLHREAEAVLKTPATAPTKANEKPE